MRSIGLYVHIPFCLRKCGYCDFNAYSGYKAGTQARYVEALLAEIDARPLPGATAPSVFFGGGTPTTLSADDLTRILQALRRQYILAPDAEISIEANPSDADPDYLAALRAAGFNRLSFGVQSFSDRLLRRLDRLHTGSDAVAAVAAGRSAGFSHLSLDLMFGLPLQSLADWERTLAAAIALDVPHLSIYGLIVEERTPFYARRERGKLPLPTEATEAAMFAAAIATAEAAGYERYEISNYARPGFRCVHNQIYWRNEEYLGLGAGAVSYLDGVRFSNERRPSRYIDEVAARGAPTAWQETLSRRETMGETMMLGLRRAEGIDLEAFARRFGERAEALYAGPIADQVRAGLLERAEGSLRLTPRGLFLANDVMAAFVGDA